MRERLAALGGRMSLEPSPLGGTRLLVVVGAGIAHPVGAAS
jgi:signal transduction histidine kinase